MKSNKYPLTTNRQKIRYKCCPPQPHPVRSNEKKLHVGLHTEMQIYVMSTLLSSSILFVGRQDVAYFRQVHTLTARGPLHHQYPGACECYTSSIGVRLKNQCLYCTENVHTAGQQQVKSTDRQK